MTAHGQCLCEEIQYTVDGELADIINCHCSRCRRSTGHFMAATEARRDQVHIVGSTLKWYEPVPGTEYGFCGTCGSTLFWRADRHPETMSIAAGTLTPPTGLKTVMQIYLDYGSDYHDYLHDVESHGEGYE